MIDFERRRGELTSIISGKSPFFFIKAGIAGIICILLLCGFLGCFYTVESGERGILLRFGEVVSIEEPGLHFKIPFIESVKFLSIRSNNVSLDTSVYSADTQAAKVQLSVNFQLNPADVRKVYVTYGQDYKQRIILPQIQSQCKDAFGTFTAVNIVRSRDEVAKKIYDNLTGYLSALGIDVTSVQIENLDFSDEYEKSVEERMKAEVEVEKLRQSLEQQKIKADMARTEAQGAADARILKAKADAEAVKMQGEAEAAIIAAKVKALNQAGPTYIELIQAEKWNGALPQTMLPSQSIPVISK